MRVYLRAVILAAVIYLPWLLWTWHYYGSPIPHTVIAKGIGRALNFTHLAKALLFYPVGTIVLPRVFDELFLPPYALMGGWPFWLQIYSRALAWLFAFCWCIPRLSARIRALSFALMVASFYLDQIAPVPFPWYLPSCTLLAFFVFAGILEQLSCSLKKRSLSSALLSTAVVAILTISLSLTLSTAFQLRIQQREIETGLRKEIGLWLGRNAATRTDSVFLEPLGYIGYFSQLKMLDFPGLSSPEVVESRKRIGRDDIPLVIRDLHPDWIVLRPLEAKGIEQKDQELLSKAYTRVKVFDASKRISVYSWLPGRAYLIRDQTFYIYQRRQ